MRIAQAAKKFGIPRYKIDYLRKTGLLSAQERGGLSFEDLIRLRFIRDCYENRLSLQMIRPYLGRSRERDEARPDESDEIPSRAPPLHARFCISGTREILLKDKDLLVHPHSGQIFLDLFAEAEGGLLLSIKESEIHKNKDIDKKTDLLEDRLFEALSRDNSEDTKRLLEEILGMNPDHLGTLIELGNVCFEAEDYDAALQTYERALLVDPFCGEVLYNMANIYFKLRKNAAAIRLYQQALDADPDFPEAYYNLALLYYSVNYVEVARNLFETYINMDPDSEWRVQAEQFINEIDQALVLEQREGENSLFDENDAPVVPGDRS